MDFQFFFGWFLIIPTILEHGRATLVINGIRGSTVTMNCTLQGTTTWYGPPRFAEYSWKDQKSENIPNNLRNRLHIVGDFQHGRYNLQIQKLRASDRGLYKCVLRKMSDTFRLKIIGNMKVKINRRTYTGQTGGSITLGCNVTSPSSAVTQIQWYFNDVRVEPLPEKHSKSTPKDPSLKILNLDKNDAGPYKCSATNKADITANSTTTTLTLVHVKKQGTANLKALTEKMNLSFKENHDLMHFLETKSTITASALNAPERFFNRQFDKNTVAKNSIADSNAVTKTIVPVIFVAVVIVLVGTVLFIRKHKPIFVLKLAHKFQKYEDDDTKLWDAFVSFKSDDFDTQFVFSKLYPKLEKELGYKLCIHQKDFLPGKAIVVNIVDAILNSRRTILIISDSYLNGGYTTFEYEVAYDEMIKSKHKIIPIFIDRVDNLKDRMDDTLKFITQSVTYISWPGDRNRKAERIFWKRLDLSMPKKHKREVADARAERSSLLHNSLNLCQ